MRVELVFTAHPTEIVRRTLLQKHNRIAQMLAVRDRPDLTPAEREQALDDLQREIAAVWQTDEVRLARVHAARRGARRARDVRAEAVGSAAAVSAGGRRALRRATGTPLPLDVTPMRFGSWIGGDRDGNPNVTPR